MTIQRTHDCGWSGQYQTDKLADYAERMHSCEKWRNLTAANHRGALARAGIDRTPKPCSHPIANHQHGTYACYVCDKCRCVPCTAARASWDENRRKQKAYGRWDNLIDAEPARQHLRALMAAGMGIKSITASDATTSGQIWKLLYGKLRQDGTRVPNKRIRRDVAQRILALQLELAPGAAMSNPGATRRLRALVALGYSQAELSRRLGVMDSAVGRIVSGRHAILVSTAKAVTELYDQLSMTPPPETTHLEKVVATRARRHAARNGWLPPLALDDECLDDDFDGGQITIELPELDVDEIALERRLAGDRTVRLTKLERREAVRRLHAQGLTDHPIADRIGTSAETVRADRARIGLPANGTAGHLREAS